MSDYTGPTTSGTSRDEAHDLTNALQAADAQYQHLTAEYETVLARAEAAEKRVEELTTAARAVTAAVAILPTEVRLWTWIDKVFAPQILPDPLGQALRGLHAAFGETPGEGATGVRL